CASKMALNAQLEGLYWDLKPRGIAVTVVCPGFVDTQMMNGQGVTRRWMLSQAEALNRITKAIAARRRCVHFPGWLYGVLLAIKFSPAALRGFWLTWFFERLFPRSSVDANVGDGGPDLTLERR
nr:SDR family NAD(P)-dependent oxidoreductase [Gammaproteobacteria bacterium]